MYLFFNVKYVLRWDKTMNDEGVDEKITDARYVNL